MNFDITLDITSTFTTINLAKIYELKKADFRVVDDAEGFYRLYSRSETRD